MLGLSLRITKVLLEIHVLKIIEALTLFLNQSQEQLEIS
jgi:hypothetical protein